MTSKHLIKQKTDYRCEVCTTKFRSNAPQCPNCHTYSVIGKGYRENTKSHAKIYPRPIIVL